MKINNISFYTDFSAKPDLIYCCENQIKQACIAILVNASEAVSEQGEITFKTFNPDDKTIAIEIRDNGVGINPEDLEHVFEPFFTAKQKVNGVGLGLPIVHGLIQNHKGKIEIDSKLGSHTTVSIFLPLNNEKPE